MGKTRAGGLGEGSGEGERTRKTYVVASHPGKKKKEHALRERLPGETRSVKKKNEFLLVGGRGEGGKTSVCHKGKGQTVHDLKGSCISI